jgi:quercetin dioxygenase-like cupin family protein
MTNIRIVDSSSLPWMVKQDVVRAGESDANGGLVEIPAEEVQEHRSAARIVHPGTDSELQLYEGRFLSGVNIDPHAHRGDQIIYVTEGQLHFGRRVLGPGSSIYIKGHTLYGFKIGPQGARFLNFRPTRDRSYISKEQFAAERDR